VGLTKAIKIEHDERLGIRYRTPALPHRAFSAPAGSARR
jgi:hypothetical protein